MTNWEPPAFSPTPGSSTSPSTNGYSIFYLTDPDPRGSMGLGGKDEVARRHRRQLPHGDRLQDRQDRLAAQYPGVFGGGGGGGLLTTAGGLVFAGDAGGNLVAHDAQDRQAALAHAHRQRLERAEDLHARRPPVSARGGRRHAVRVSLYQYR